MVARAGVPSAGEMAVNLSALPGWQVLCIFIAASFVILLFLDWVFSWFEKKR